MTQTNNWWKQGATAVEAAKPEGDWWKQGAKPVDAEPPSRGLIGWGQDIAATAVKGAIAVPEAIVGLADIPTGGAAGKFLENKDGAVGLRFKEAKEIVNDWHSDATKEAQRKFEQADGIVEKAKTAIQNPSLVATAIGESLPSMGLGGAAARGLMAATRLGQMGAKGAVLAGAAGEGIVGAGSQAEQIRQETSDGLLTPGQSAAAVATGATTAAFGYAGGKLAQRLGIGDAETMLAQGQAGMAKQFADTAATAAANPLVQQKAIKGIPRQVIEGAIAEGFLEELPQSLAEQLFQNIALDKPWDQDLDSAAVMGVLSGATMGAGAAGYRGMKESAATKLKDGKPEADGQPTPDGLPADAPQEAPEVNAGLARVREAYQAQLQSLQAQEQGEPSVPQSAPPDGAAALAQQQALAQAARDEQMAASRAVESPDDEILQSTGAVAQRPSEAMGLRSGPEAGALESVAAMAVDSGAHAQVQQESALAQAAQEAEKQSKSNQKVEQKNKRQQEVDANTGEISGPRAEADLSAWGDADLSNAFRGAQDLGVRRQLAKELSRRRAQRAESAPQADLATSSPQPPATAPGANAKGANVATLAQLNRKKLAEMSTDELHQLAGLLPGEHARQEKIQKAIQSRVQQEPVAINKGVSDDGTQTDQAQQTAAQPAQAGRAQSTGTGDSYGGSDGGDASIRPAAGQRVQPGTAEQGLTDGTTQTANPGAQATPAPGTQAQAQSEGRQERARRIADAGQQWQRMPAAERAAAVGRLEGVKPVLAKNMPRAEWNNLNADIQGKLADAMGPQTPGNAIHESKGAQVLTSQEPVATKSVATTAADGAQNRESIKQQESQVKSLQVLASQEPVATKNEAKGRQGDGSGVSQGDEKPFAAETGTLGIPRADMPQVPTSSHGGLVKHLNAQGIAHETTTVDAASLKPTQAEYSPSKVEAAKGAGGDRAVIVSKDGHIIDGHHQAVAAAEEGKQVKAIVLDAPVEQALEAVKASPSAQVPSVADVHVQKAASGKEQSESVVARKRGQKSEVVAESQAEASKPEPKKPRGVAGKVAQAQQARADYFTPGNIVKSYAGHDRVITYTPPNADGQWSVTVQAVEKKGDAWVNVLGERQRTHGTQPDARELKAGPVETVKVEPTPQEGDHQPVKEPAAPPASHLERHNAIEDSISAGTLALGDYKAAFAELDANQDAVQAELQKLTKAELLKAGGSMFAYRMKDDKKESIVQAAYQKMLDTYALGRNYGPSSFFLSAESIAKNKADKAQALRDLVANTTDEDLAARAAEIKGDRDEFKAKREAAAQALANPKSLDDFRAFMRHWMEKGEASEAAYLRLTPEQRRSYDSMEAEQTKDSREAAKRRAKVSVVSAGNTTAGEVIATKHTKHGHDLYVVQLAERVERDDYETLNGSAKRLGGSYSSYRGGGAIPGFQFRTREAAEAFQKLVGGDTAQAQRLAEQRRDAFEDDKSQSAAERLRTMADALDERATEALVVDRKVNTSRRARFAASAEAAARGQQALAGTMRNIAQAIDDGSTKFLDGVRQRVQVEYLMAQLRAAKSNQLQAKYPEYSEQMKRQGEPIDAETVDFARFPRFEMFRSDLASLARQLLEIDGGKKMGAALEKLADDVSDAYIAWAKDNLLSVSHFGNKADGGFAEFASKDVAERAIKRAGLVGKAVVLPIKRGQNRVILSPGEAMQRGLWQGDGDKRIRLSMEFVEQLAQLGKRKGSKVLALPWQLESALENRQRLQRMGIQTPAEFRSALRELASLQQELATPDRIKELERSMVGRANDGLDFFPTSPAVVQSMLDAAEIAEGMAVLEPSAGMGHIADAIVAETGVWPDVVEISGQRRELLEAKGFHLAEVNDFMNMEPRRFFTYGDTFRAPDGSEGIMRGVGGMGSQRVRLEDAQGNRLGLYDRSELVGVAQNGSWSGYDRIVMNPPFSDGRDIQHVMHAYSLLRPGGRIVAIMGEGAFFQSNKRAEAFRDWLDERGATNEKLPDGSFMDPSLPVNTAVAARMVVIDKPQGDAELARSVDDTANFEGNARRRPGSAQDKAVMQAIADGKSSRDVLRLVASGSKDPFSRQVARLLLRAGITPNIEFGHIGKGKNGAPIHGQYRGKSDTIAIAASAEYAAERIFMHEAMHAATMRALAKPGLAKLQMEKLLAHVRKQKGAAGFYGTKNVDEFVAEAFTNPDFQTALRQMSAPAGGTIKSAWDGFVRILRGILGLSNDSTNVLSQALELGVAAMREDMALRKQGSQLGNKGDANMAENLRGLARSAVQPGNDNNTVMLGQLSAQELSLLQREGVAVQEGFSHAADMFAVRHALNRHSDAKIEKSRGQIPITEDDVAHIADAIEHPTAYVLGGKTPRGQDVVGIIKRLEDGTLLYLEEVRTGRKTLAMTSMRKYPGTTDFDTIANSVLPSNARSDTGAVRIVYPDGGNGQVDTVANFGTDDLARVKDSALAQLNQALSHPGKVSLWDKTVGTMRHLAERNPAFKPVFESAQRFIDDVSTLANEAAAVAPRLLPRVETMGDLKKKPITAADNKAVAKPLFEGTLMWARDLDGTPVTTEALNDKYRNIPTVEKAQIMLRTGKIEPGQLKAWKGLPIEQFDAIINNKFDSNILKPGLVWSPKELKTLFGSTDQQVSLYQEARAAIDRSLDITARTDMLRLMGEQFAAMRDAVLEQPSLKDAFELVAETLQAEARANPDAAERLLAINNSVVSRYEMAADLMEKGYAPLTRFGKYTLDVLDKNGDRQFFSMFETERESNVMKLKMASLYPGATITQGTMSESAFKLFQGITPESLEQFGEMLGLRSDGNEAKDKAFQAYLQLSKNNHNALKRLIHRKGIDGYSEDVGRVLASFVYSNARLGANGLNAGTMERAVEGIPKEQGELRDVAMGLRSYIQDPQEEGQAVRGFLFAQYLGGSIASAAVNMTQPFQITMPWLSQYGGMGQASKQMARALKDMATKGFKYEADLAKALQDAEDDGTVSPQEIHQLMAQARGAGALRTGDGTRAGDARAAAANNWERLKVAWGQPFALAEQFNRRSTFIASYRIAKAQGMSNPAEFARKAVLETQFLYSKANKMRFARGAVGGTLMTFKTYSVSYLELMHRMWTQGGPEGKRAVAWSVAMLLLMAGAGGLPFMEDAEDLIDGAGQLMGYNLSSKQWRKDLMRDTLGKEFADFMEQGISGLPGAPIDVSGRMGLGNLIPGTGLFLNKQNRERDLLEVAGPAGDLVKRAFTGGGKLLTGDVAGAALEVSPTAVRNWAKGYDMGTSGIYKDTKGYKVIDTTFGEALAKFAGFQPKSVAEVQEANSFMQRSKSFYTQTSSDIKAQWAKAVFEKDDAALQRVRERLDAWNRDNPDQRITVKIPDVMKRVREMGKDRTQRIADTAPKALRQQMKDMAREVSS
jgi:hypothetical protein